MFLTTFSFRKTFNFRLVCSVLVICASQLSYGFDNTGYSAIQSINAFEKQFGTYNPKTQKYGYDPVWLSLFNSLIFIGFFVGVNIGSVVSKHFGRRMCMFSMSCWALVTATINISATTPQQIMAGRILNYIFTGMELSCAPVFQSEITPKAARGFVVGTYQFCIVLGGLLTGAICYSTQNRKDSSAYRIPFGIYYIVPSLVICTIWLIPESPRWLVMKDRHEEALKSLTILRKGKFTEQEIQDELNEIILALEHERQVGKGRPADMFKGSDLKRTLIVVAANFFLQATGQSFGSQYGSLFIKSLGTINQFQMQMISTSTQLLTGLLSMFCSDRLGRRKMLLIGGTIQVVGLMSMGALGTVRDPSYAIRCMIVGMMTLFGAGYVFGWAPIVHTLSAELPSARLRDLTYGLGALFSVTTNFAVAFSLPYLLYPPYANLQSRVGFIYGSISACSIMFAYLCVPECRGRSLEDISQIFDAGTPLRKFHKVQLEPPETLVRVNKDHVVVHVEDKGV